MTSILFSVPPPLSVSAFGRVWHLTAWLEPVWWIDGRLAALEVLSRLRDRDSGVQVSPELFFSQLPLPEQLRVLCWQLEILVLMKPWCAAREVMMSLNITRQLAILILSNPEVMEKLLLLAPCVRLEISENFLLPDSQPDQDSLLPSLQQLAPLWLDDFGTGSTGLSWLMSGMFEVLKIARPLMEVLKISPGGEAFLAGLCGLAHGAQVQVISEGVADLSMLTFARKTKVSGCQGWLWPGFRMEQLHQIPDRLPMGKHGAASGASGASGASAS
ncbi:EAL domain-containing protein [Klebsiella pasteurii]|uniref:Cyclic di-GMP phosphodiesterase YhjH n=1 Tax=Klebsiella pasteurii TaxID=2587529 RepID=A0A9Q9SAA7_9ENTR|nr:EAL domain-containing protein [Klebsiella pasteurii]VUS97224.1 Cyclic di-GMP phosphodiesterase YhjH [Klebsiella pasteurii]VUT00693.1 Cyclic di-GMP phosphodiesterase YhjH [Klebsiella pasteurii]